MRRRVLAAAATGTVLVVLTAVTLNGLLYFRPLPTIDGHYRFLGLDESAEVTRDGFGVPRVYAQTTHDMFFLQGYVTAQDRFAQMEEMRSDASGFVPESRAALDTFDLSLRTVLDAYAAGVSKFIEQHADAHALPASIALTGAVPARWVAEDVLALALANLRPLSECIAVGGEHTFRSQPLLVARLRVNMEPPGWYEIGLSTPHLQAVGMSIPGVPALLSGHNGSVAWAFHRSARSEDPQRTLGALVRALGAATSDELVGDGSPLDEGPVGGCVADTRGQVAGAVPSRVLAGGSIVVSGAGATTAHERHADLVERSDLTVEDLRLRVLARSSSGEAVLIIDLGDLDASKAALSTGQSAHPAALHYMDQKQLWEAGQLHRLAWTRERIARIEGHLVLRPR